MMKECRLFETRNGDVSVRIDCANYGRHLREAARRLSDASCDPSAATPPATMAKFSTESQGVSFVFDSDEPVTEQSFSAQAVFFENTDYPLSVKALRDGVILKDFRISGHGRHSISEADDEGTLLYGNMNFKNQVGLTDLTVVYTDGKEKRELSFTTEVLSYKTDYRKDMRELISDIEKEYAMLSYSFMKDTYLEFRNGGRNSSDLIWWQIFQQCYHEILDAAHTIISSPKRRLKAEVRYERAERLRMILPENEREYSEFKDDPHHLYRTEELILSKDTVENRFLKHVVKEITRRFETLRELIRKTLRVEDSDIAAGLDVMSEELGRLSRHPFFRQIGTFKGFSQDSLVMKKARGYTSIYRDWLKLQCGYELAAGTQHLEVKDISELYEIWCFIRIKQIVADILGDDTEARSSGMELSGDFIRQLSYGTQSEVTFLREGKTVASVMYNAQVEEGEADSDWEDEECGSAIDGTASLTTVQRPDIVLRIADQGSGRLEYTYLFDAKYRLKGSPQGDVPPRDAVDQMHRYRDAILIRNDENSLGREVISGDILYPGRMTAGQVRASHYYQSHVSSGIGAFPLRPGSDSVIVNPDDSENVLREEISSWLKQKDWKSHLVGTMIPHKGLKYLPADEDVQARGLTVLGFNIGSEEEQAARFASHDARVFIMGKGEPVNLQSIGYFVPFIDGSADGYYQVDRISLIERGGENLIRFKFGQYISFGYPASLPEELEGVTCAVLPGTIIENDIS